MHKVQRKLYCVMTLRSVLSKIWFNIFKPSPFLYIYLFRVFVLMLCLYYYLLYMQSESFRIFVLIRYAYNNAFCIYMDKRVNVFRYLNRYHYYTYQNLHFLHCFIMFGKQDWNFKLLVISVRNIHNS